MQITVQAKIILLVPEPDVGERPEMIVLDVENYLNGLGIYKTPECQTQVGIRVHTAEMEVLH